MAMSKWKRQRNMGLVSRAVFFIPYLEDVASLWGVRGRGPCQGQDDIDNDA
jgi:hypothetical protein